MITHFMRVVAALIPLVGAAHALASEGLVLPVRDKTDDPGKSISLYEDSQALVIGRGIPDTLKVAEALKTNGFDVEKSDTPSDADMPRLLQDFFAKRASNPNARAVLWFSGPASALDELEPFLEQASARHVLMVLDTCASPSLFSAVEPKPAPTVSWSATLPARQFLTHCRKDGEASFSDAFLAALAVKSPADANTDGFVTGSELASHLVRAFGASVTFGPTKRTGFQKGDIVFHAGSPPPRRVMEDMEGARYAPSVGYAPPSPSAPMVMGSAQEMMANRAAGMGSGTMQMGSGAMHKMAMGAPGMPSPAPSALPPSPKPMPGDIDRERYRDAPANPVQATRDSPVSTFSIDVDTASYANVRRYLRDGETPPRDAVRIEEMVNYFDYAYPQPKDRAQPFLASVSLMPTPWNAKTKLLHIGLKGYDIVPEARPRANLVFLLDVSGSMTAPDRLPLLKQSLRLLTQEMRDDDTIAIVTYAGNAGTALEPTSGRERSKILAALESLESGGSTAGGEGILAAYALAERNLDKKAVNRVILGTDGDFNVGVADPKRLEDMIADKRKSGVYLSILGFGRGNLNDALIQRLTQAGNGNASYIDTLSEARKVLVDQMASTLFPIANDVKIQVEFNPARVAEYRLIGYETRMLKREDFANDQVDAGEIGSGHRVTALYELTPPGSGAELLEPLRYKEKEKEAAKTGLKAEEYAFLRLRHKLPGETNSSLIERPITDSDAHARIEDAPADSRFAAAVAAFAQLLRGDPYTSNFTYKDVLSLAQPARGEDPFGTRAEFVQLVRAAQITQASAKAK